MPIPRSASTIIPILEPTLSSITISTPSATTISTPSATTISTSVSTTEKSGPVSSELRRRHSTGSFFLFERDISLKEEEIYRKAIFIQYFLILWDNYINP